jgi:beta-phosphoglucomutase
MHFTPGADYLHLLLSWNKATIKQKLKQMDIEAVIFDLDGVLVSTDEFHYLAWKELADELGVPFDRYVNERLRGVSRMESLEIILEKSAIKYTPQEKEQLADKKNDRYRMLLNNLSADDILPGVMPFINLLKQKNIRMAIGSSSKNAPLILEKTRLKSLFELVVDGNHITNSKPDPEVFLKAAQQLGVKPENCLVVEDADAGVEAAIRAGMKVLAVGSAASNTQSHFSEVDLTSCLKYFDLDVLNTENTYSSTVKNKLFSPVGPATIVNKQYIPKRK